jgi:predicted nucleic acid-binding protein
MPSRVLDTNRLVDAWKYFRGGRRLEDCKLTDARQWGKQYAEEGQIVRPVRIEFLCGAVTEHERRLFEAFLDEFILADDGKVIPQDWDIAENIAKSIRKLRPSRIRGAETKEIKRRQLGDCLIEAICRRLGRECDTADRGYPKG